MKPDYGIDSPVMVWCQLALGLAALAFGIIVRHTVWIVVGAYFLHGAASMLHYSKRGKLRLRDALLDAIPWCGDEQVLDVGCGKGLLLIGAARRLTAGRATGVDIWIPHAVSGNGAEAVLRNAELEGVADRIELKHADVRQLPFGDGSFDVVVSNFVLHEMSSAADRTKMLREIIRVLRPGGRLALIDFIFTKDCVEVLRREGMTEAGRTRMGGLRFWVGLLFLFGTFQLYRVTARK
jgi:SAM-dependent methyltransferase